MADNEQSESGESLPQKIPVSGKSIGNILSVREELLVCVSSGGTERERGRESSAPPVPRRIPVDHITGWRDVLV